MDVLGKPSVLRSTAAGAGTRPTPAPGSRRALPPPSALLIYPQAGDPFETLSRLARSALRVPTAFVAVLDPDPVFAAHQAAIGDPEDRRDFAQRSYCRKVIASGRELVLQDARADADPDADCFTEADGLVAWAGVPVLVPDGSIIGALCVADRAPRQWTGREIGLLRDLARAAAAELALHTALVASRKHAAERALLARTLQESLLPPWLPQIPGLEVAAEYVAGGGEVDVLGDFYDVFPSVRGSWGVVVGDVCGKGVPAAKSTALARYTLRAEAHRETRPSLVLTALNRALLDWPTDDPRFLTAVYATVRTTPAGATVQISSAGHPLALVHRADGRVQEIGRPGSLLGLFPQPRLSDSRAKLQPGDSLVMFTDGVTEARRPDRPGLFGDDRLRAVLAGTGDQSAMQIADTVQQAVRAFGGVPLADDTVVLVVQVPVRQGGVAADEPDPDHSQPGWSARGRSHITIPAMGLNGRGDGHGDQARV